MNLEKTSIVLKKINRLHELISGLGEVNATEKDLLKAYVVDLYEAVALSDIAEVKDEDDEDVKKRLKKLKKDEKKLKKQVEKKQKAILEQEEEDDDEDDSDDVIDETFNVAEEVEETEVEEVQEDIVEPVAAPSVSAELIELFDLPELAELSDRLANAPISDLTKSMGINEKIFTVNELFGGNQSEMDNMLVALNGLSSYSEAASVLQRSVAVKYNWTDAGKIKKVKNFLRLVKRRYN